MKKEKKYKVGFFGGKFMPMHKGHLHCVEKMAEECETAYLILFMGGNQEKEILNHEHEGYLEPVARFYQINRVAHMFPNVAAKVIDVSECVYPNGEEDWEAETPLVRAVCGDKIDAVYGSEPSYAEYFEKAYPEAEYRLVDVARGEVPISGTACRAMSAEEREKWMV